MSLMAAASPCRADESQQLFDLARNRYDAAQFKEAHDRFAELLDTRLPPCITASLGAACHLTDPDLVERARTLDAVSLLALKREVEADAQIAAIYRQNPAFAPSAASFPVEVIDRFTKVRASMRAELEAVVQKRAKEDLARRAKEQDAKDAEAKWIADLEKLAGEERIVRENTRWLALVPFGVGQYQNGNLGLGITFTTSEVLLGAASLISIAVYNGYVRTYSDLVRDNKLVSAAQVNSLVNTAVVVNRVTFGGWAAVTVAGIIQAQVAFVPEVVTTRKRPVPPKPKITPVITATPGNYFLGVQGSF